MSNLLSLVAMFILMCAAVGVLLGVLMFIDRWVLPVIVNLLAGLFKR